MTDSSDGQSLSVRDENVPGGERSSAAWLRIFLPSIGTKRTHNSEASPIAAFVGSAIRNRIVDLLLSAQIADRTSSAQKSHLAAFRCPPWPSDVTSTSETSPSNLTIWRD